MHCHPYSSAVNMIGHIEIRQAPYIIHTQYVKYVVEPGRDFHIGPVHVSQSAVLGKEKQRRSCRRAVLAREAAIETTEAHHLSYTEFFTPGTRLNNAPRRFQLRKSDTYDEFMNSIGFISAKLSG